MQNIERMKNRRVKYVYVRRQDGLKEYPPLDDPSRIEDETILSSDRRWLHRLTWFSLGKRRRETVDVWDGSKGTYVKTDIDDNGPRTTAEIDNERRSHHHLNDLEMCVEQRIVDLLGIRSEVTPSLGGGGFVVLNARVDDRSEIKELLTLDPARNYWVAQRDYEYTGNNRSTHRRTVVDEFVAVGNGWYPKRVSTDEGAFYTVLHVEFPAAFKDADFVVEIPKGTPVLDKLKRGRYIEGEEPPSPPPSNEPGLLDDLKQVPGEDWLFYGGFVVAVSAVVVIGLFFFARRPTKQS